MVAIISSAVAVSCMLAQETDRSSKKAKQLSPAFSQVGRQTFASTCASCHGLDGKGGERGPDIATRPEVVRLSDEEISRVLRTGIPQSGMPAFAALGSAKISAVLNHLRTLQGRGALPPLPGNADQGRKLFAGKAGCSECHMVQGVGGFLGSDLSSYGASRSVSEIRDAIVGADKRSGSPKALAQATTKDGHTIAGLVRNEDNFSLQLQSLDGALHFLAKSDLAELTFSSKPLMPEDYATKLSAGELDQVVAYLLSVAYSGQERGARVTKAKKGTFSEE
jgi:cytochrome c oxidase cbb3-type subunit 3